MKTIKILLFISTLSIMAACNNNAPTNETNPGANDMNTMDSNRSDNPETGNPDIGGSEMHNPEHHATDSMGEKTTGGK